MAQTMSDFVSEMRQLAARWRDDIVKLESAGESELVDQIKAWIEEAERIIEAHENVHA
jgi:hypothetical protein